MWYKGLFFFEPFQNKLLTCRPNNRMLYCMEDRIPHSYNVMMRMRKSTLLYSYFYHLILKPYTSIWIGVHEYQLHCLLPLVVFLLGWGLLSTVSWVLSQSLLVFHDFVTLKMECQPLWRMVLILILFLMVQLWVGCHRRDMVLYLYVVL